MAGWNIVGPIGLMGTRRSRPICKIVDPQISAEGPCVSEVSGFWAHRTPSADGCEVQNSAISCPHTIATKCRCHLVCPYTIVRYMADYSGFARCHTVRTASYIAGCTAVLDCPYGGSPCRAIH